MQLSRVKLCSCCKTFWMWTAIESTKSKTVEPLGNISIFYELDESRKLWRSFVEKVKGLGPNKDP